MKEYYYIPTSSLNFNNILSSESISPKIFYEKRGFGNKRFYSVESNPFLNSNLAFSKIPDFHIHGKDREEFPLYLAVPRDYLIMGNHIKENECDIYQLKDTIYINWVECFFVVNNKFERKKLIATTHRTLELKNSDEYIKKIFTKDTLKFERFIWDEEIINNINDIRSIDFNELIKDQRRNKVKGLFYGYMAGWLREQKEEIVIGKNYFKEFINVYSALINEFSQLSKAKNRRITKSVYDELNHLKDLYEPIYRLFNAFEDNNLEEEIINSFALNREDLKKLKTFEYRNHKKTILDIVKDFIKSKHPESLSISELIQALIFEGNEFIKSPSLHRFNKIENNFNTYRLFILKRIEEIESEQIRESDYNITFQQENFIEDIKFNFSDIPTLENQYFDVIISEILQFREISNSDEISQNLKEILKVIGTSIKNVNGSEEIDVKYLQDLYRAVTSVGTRFKIDGTNKKSLQALACVLSRHSDMSKLQDFMEKNKFYSFRYAYMIWGALYGYSSLSKVLLAPLSSNIDVYYSVAEFSAKLNQVDNLDSNAVDNFISTLDIPQEQTTETKFNQSEQIKDDTTPPINKGEQLEIFQTSEQSEDSDTEGPVVVDLKVNKTDNSQTEFGFMDAIKQNNVLGKRPDWIEFIEASFNLFNEEVKSKPEMGIGTMKHKFENILDDEKKRRNISLFGDQKKKLTIEMFMTYIQSNE